MLKETPRLSAWLTLHSKQEVAPRRGQPRAQNESAAALSHMESSRATAISNVIPAISAWPKMAMVNSICTLVGICLVPRQWTRFTKWQRSVNESLPHRLGTQDFCGDDVWPGFFDLSQSSGRPDQ